MAGTAPLLSLAERRGYVAFFNDLNPLHLFVNAAKTFPSYLTFRDIGPSRLLSIARRITSRLDRCARTVTDEWIERPVLDGLKHAWEMSEKENESIVTLMRAILLLSVRDLSSFIITKNPMWIKPGGLRPKISTEQTLRSAIERLDIFYKWAYDDQSEVKGGRIVLTDYDASQSTIERKVDVVITSPPLCNRIDWGRIYAPELFFLNSVGFWHNKVEFCGTMAVRGYSEFDSEIKFVTGRSEYLGQFMKEVQKRQRGIEKSYYTKYFTRYFATLFRIFDMAASALKEKNAGIYFIVRDCRYRGLTVRIGQALVESLSIHRIYVRHLRCWVRKDLGLKNISRHDRKETLKQAESIWHAVNR